MHTKKSIKLTDKTLQIDDDNFIYLYILLHTLQCTMIASLQVHQHTRINISLFSGNVIDLCLILNKIKENKISGRINRDK